MKIRQTTGKTAGSRKREKTIGEMGKETEKVMKNEKQMSCVDCRASACEKENPVFPPFCTTLQMSPELVDEALKCYEEKENHKVMAAAAEVEYEHYCQYTRVEEIIAFAEKIGAKKLGIATCVGLLREAGTLAKILRAHGFEVFGVSCKAGAVRKTSVGIPKECEELGCHMCNPILQAKMLNEQKTDLNLVVGLCVGHDSMFYKYSEALVTTVVTKDRVLGHNPAAALYNAESYYKKKLFGESKK